MKILVVGSGYVGLVTGACFAEMGHHVTCLDIDSAKIELLKRGHMPIYEPGLKELVLRNVEAKRLAFTTEYSEGVKEAEVCFLAVPTPADEDGSADIGYVLSAARSVARQMHKELVIVNKSTVPVGTAFKVRQEVTKILKERQLEISFDVVSNPEFLKEGDAISDFMKPDRIVIGCTSEHAKECMQELYAPFNLNHDRLLIMDPTSAEMTKYAANAMLASRISFMNEIAGLAELLGADITKIRKGIGADSRIGYSFLYAGAGYGGSCFPKDVQALVATAKEHEYPTPMIDAIEQVNARQKQVLAKKIISYFADQGGVENKVIAIWGLAFKPGTDDLRQAPALEVIDILLKEGARLALFDPVALEGAKRLFKTPSPQLRFALDEYDAARGADAIALMTEWKQFRFVDIPKLYDLMRGHAFFDGRNQYSPEEMVTKGFDYFSIGSPPRFAKSGSPSRECSFLDSLHS